MTGRYEGVFPVVPTTFDEGGGIDLASQLRCVDFMLDAGSDGLCILANFSEQFLLADEERAILTRAILDHVAGRVPVIVTTSHFSSRICAERSRQAQAWGAAMVMIMPPYHGATFRVAEPQVVAFFQQVSDAINIPIMIQNAPVAGTPLSAALLARMAREIEHVSYFKIETAGAATKLRELIRLGGEAVIGPWDGEEGISLLPDLEAGATGAMTGGGFPDGIRSIVDPYRAGRRDEAIAAYETAADQSGEPPVRASGGQGVDEGRRGDRLRGRPSPAAAARSPCPAAFGRDRPQIGRNGPALGPLSVTMAPPFTLSPAIQ